ncbi:MAG: hypothetical protein ACKOFD_09020 [Actinomycetota bacterium]
MSTRRAFTVASLAMLFSALPLTDVARANSGLTKSQDSSDTTLPITQSTFVYDLEEEPSQCIGLLPKPNCGKKPEQAGDRGGALQWLVFAILIAAVGTIATVVVRNVIRRDREIAARLERESSSKI